MNKKLAKIPATLLGKKETVALKLKEEPYLIIIPKIFFDKAGGILTKCPKCGLDGDIGLEMSYQKNEWEIQTKQGEPLGFWKK